MIRMDTQNNLLELKRKYSFDMYARYACIRDIINQNRKGKKQFQILDVGGRGNILVNFLQDDQVFYLDTHIEKDSSNFIEGDGCNMPLEDRSFDWVVSADVYEHIKSESRIQFLNEQIRVAREGVILTAPFHSEDVVQAEINVAEIYRLLTGGQEHPWLREHFENGLPSERELENHIEQLGMEYQKIPNNSLAYWEILQSVCVNIEKNYSDGMACDVGDFNFYCNNMLYPFDIADKSYRKVYFIKKTKTLKNLTLQAKELSFTDILSHVMKTLTRILAVQNNNFCDKLRDVAELEKSCTEKDKQIDEGNSRIQKLKESCVEKDEQISADYIHITKLEAVNAKNDKQIDEDNSLIQKLERSCIKKDRRISDDYIRITKLEALNAKKDRQIDEGNNRTQKLEELCIELEKSCKKKDNKTLENNDVISELNFIKSSVSYRIADSLRRVKCVMCLYSVFRPFLKFIFRIVKPLHNEGSVLPSSKNKTPNLRKSSDGKIRILLVSQHCPSRSHAGGLRILDIYSMLKKCSSNVRLDVYTYCKPDIDKDCTEIQNIFDNVYFGKQHVLRFEEFIQMQSDLIEYDVIDFQYIEATEDIRKFKDISKKIIFTPMELLLRDGILNMQLKTIIKYGFREIYLSRIADKTICVSEPDAKILQRFSQHKKVMGLSTCLSPYEFSEELSKSYSPHSVSDKRNTVLYLAHFGSPTNIQALKWYLSEVHPRIVANLNSYVFIAAGGGDLTDFLDFQNEHFNIIGYVDKIAPVISSAKVGIAPALSGAGFRGKINQYALCGLPCVTTPLGATGLVYKKDKDIFIESDPRIYADKIIALLTDNNLNERIRESARKACIANYAWESKISDIKDIYGVKF